MRNMKKMLSFLLAFSMVLQFVPMPGFAAEGDACSLTENCTGIYDAEGRCTVCGETESAPEHTHIYDGEAAYAPKDETVHTVTRACTTCEEKPTETVDEPHTYVEGVCACGREEPHAHFGGEATCKAQAVCEGCGEAYGQLAGHSYEDLKCTVCGADQPCICETGCQDIATTNWDCPVCAEDFGLCAHYVPTCLCAEKCTEENVNNACPICGIDHTKCGCEDRASGYAGGEKSGAAEITAVSITIDGTIYDSTNTTEANPARITPGSTATLIVTGTNFNNDTNNNAYVIISGGPIPIKNSHCEINADGSSATINLSSYSLATTPFEICYKNAEDQSQIQSGVFAVYDITNAAKITGVSITLDREIYNCNNTSENNPAVVKPTSTVSLSVTGEKLNACTYDNLVYYGSGGMSSSPYNGWNFGTDYATASIPINASNFDSTTDVYEIKYTNDRNYTQQQSGVYVIYASPITVTCEDEKGTVTAKVEGAEVTSAVKGTAVTLTVTPEAGYQLKTLTVTNAETTKVSETQYTFTMPGAAVEVNATFEEIGKYSVWVQGVQITETNKDNVLVDEGKTVSYDPVTYTLTLNGANITAASANGSTSTYGIYASGDLNVAVGTNGATISGGNYGIEVTNGLKISGGTLTVSGGDIIGLKAKIVVIENSDVTVTTNGHAICANAGGAITISGSTVTATGGTDTTGGGNKYGLAGGVITLGANTNLIASGATAAMEVTPTLAPGASGVSRTAFEDEFVSGIVYNGESYFEFKSTIPVESITLDEPGALYVGQSEELTATVSPDNATNKTVTWSSSNTDVATVSTDGVVTAVSAGETTITVTTEDGNHKATCKVKVVAEYPVWVAGVRVTSDNMNDVLGDGKVSYDPATFTLTLNNATINCTESGKAAIDTNNTMHTLKILGTGTNTISATGGSGIYVRNQNVSISGGTFVISGSTHGVVAENGSLTIDGAQVKATGASGNFGAYAKGIVLENDGGLLAVNGTKAAVRGSYIMGSEQFDELGVAENAVLTISSGETVEVKDEINSSGTIKINGTLKVPAGSGRNTMSGGTLYIGDKGYQWHEGDRKYYCVTHDWVYTATDKDITPGTESISIRCGSCDFDSGFLSIEADDAIYDGESHGARLNTDSLEPDGAGAPSRSDIRYQTQDKVVESLVNAGTYKASIAMGDATAYVEYTISPKSLTGADITVTLAKTVVTDPKEIPQVTVKHGNKILKKGTDYVIVTAGVPASGFGECEIDLQGVADLSEDGLGGNYSGVVTKTYLLLDRPGKVEPDNKDAIDAYDRYSDERYKNIYGDELTKALEELHEALTDYEIIKGHKSNYVKGSYKKLSFTVNGYYGKFTGVEVDGKLLDKKYYTSESGSTIITLRASYLETLKTGKHYIQVNYTDGSTDGKDYFRVSTNNGSPMTGDDSHMMLFGGMGLISLLCLAMMVMFIPRKKGKYEG